MAIPLLLASAVLGTLVYEHTEQVLYKKAGVLKPPVGNIIDKDFKPINGTVVCCGIYEKLTHTGIWLNDGIVELAGNGLIRTVSPQRFLSERSGQVIYGLGDANKAPLASADVAKRASVRLFSYEEYHVITNNCHQFVARCFPSDMDKKITLFNELNLLLVDFYQQPLYFYPFVNKM